MSYARFSGHSDVYIFEHVSGYIQCCGCRLAKPEDEEIYGFANFKTAKEALQHLDIHVLEGDKVPTDTFRRIREDYPDLDAKILPYVESLKSTQETQKIINKFYGRQNV